MRVCLVSHFALLPHKGADVNLYLFTPPLASVNYTIASRTYL